MCGCSWLLGYPAVYLVAPESVDMAAAALSAADALLVQLHVPCLVGNSIPAALLVEAAVIAAECGSRVEGAFCVLIAALACYHMARSQYLRKP